MFSTSYVATYVRTLFDFACKDLGFDNHICVQPQRIVWPLHFLNAPDTSVIYSIRMYVAKIYPVYGMCVSILCTYVYVLT